MKVVKRWGVMTLVALLVLGTMGAALADDGVETEETKEALEPGDYATFLDWADGLVQFVFYWGYQEGEEPDGCVASQTEGWTGMFGLFGPTQVTEAGDCLFLNVEKNGHYNHGSMVSSFVHWLKDGKLEVLLDELEAADSNLDLQDLRDMPKGQLIKEFAHLDFGKGYFDPDEESPLTEVVAGDDDGGGPPAWVLEKKADKAETGGKKK